MTRVVLLEFIEEFEALKGYAAENGLTPADFRIIAIEFKLQAYLKKCGVAFDNTLPYFTGDSHARVLLGAEGLLRHVEGHLDYCDSVGIKNAYGAELTHYLEIYFNYVAKIVEILDGVCARHPDAVIYAPARLRVTDSAFVSDDFILGDIAGRFAKARGVECRLFGNAHTGAEDGVKKSGAAGAVYWLLLKALGVYIRILGKAPVLVSSKGHGLGKMLDGIRRQSPAAIYILPRDFAKRRWYHRWAGALSGFFTGFFFVDIFALPGGADLAAQSALSERLDRAFAPSPVFYYNGLDISGILRAKMQAAFKRHLGRMNQWGHQIDGLVRGLGVRLIISSHGTGIWHAAAEVSRMTGVPSLFVSHGTHPAPVSRLHELSIFTMCRGFMLGDFTHIAVATPVQEAHLAYFKKKYERLKSEEIKTGSLIFAGIDAGDREKARAAFGFRQGDFVVVHAVSLKWKGSERPHFLETPDEYVSGLADVVEAVNRLKDVRLIIRLHPGFDFMMEDVSRFLPESDRYVLSIDGAFKDVLAASDMLVSYSSTTVDEALINRIPVLLYDKWARYNHFGTGVYQDEASLDVFPVCYVNSKDRLSGALEFMIKKTKDTPKGQMDVSRYRYNEDLTKNLYAFTKDALAKEHGL